MASKLGLFNFVLHVHEYSISIHHHPPPQTVAPLQHVSLLNLEFLSLTVICSTSKTFVQSIIYLQHFCFSSSEMQAINIVKEMEVP